MITATLIGSHAINVHVPGFREKPVDVDLLLTADGFQQFCAVMMGKACAMPIGVSGVKWSIHLKTGQIYEIEIVQPGSSSEEIFNECSASQTVIVPGIDPIFELKVPSLETLFMLKLSHKYLKDSPHFVKTRTDIETLRELITTLSEKETARLKKREVETYNYKHPSLKQSKQGFFSGDQVKYIYDHDSLHEVVKVKDVPAYSLFKPTDSEVMVSRSMFDALPVEDQLNSVLEESYVLALERSQIPHKGKITPKDSFLIALSKVCTSITSGWWRAFAYENYFKVLVMYDESYLTKFETALANGKIKPFSGSLYS